MRVKQNPQTPLGQQCKLDCFVCIYHISFEVDVNKAFKAAVSLQWEPVGQWAHRQFAGPGSCSITPSPFSLLSFS